MYRSETEVQDMYADLLEGEDQELALLAQILDAGYGMHAPPTELRERLFGIPSYNGTTPVSEPTGTSLRSALS